jgi:release factor glutamine methyltransferase
MLTVLESLKLSTEFLEKKAIESARLNAELLLAEILNCKRLDLYLKFDQPLKEKEVDQYREWISRRGKYEPLQYIIGKVEFFGLQFKVNSNVLIPRPETEILVEEVIKEYKDKVNLRILDIGTGSGNIPIALSKNLTDAEITSIDVSSKALDVAKENAISNGVESKINFILSDINHFTHDTTPFDLIISNPPYISADEYSTLQKEITDYEPSIALTDSNDGLEFYRTIASKSNSLLKSSGKIFLETGQGQFEDVRKILQNYQFHNIEIVKDYQQIERVISGELK